MSKKSAAPKTAAKPAAKRSPGRPRAPKAPPPSVAIDHPIENELVRPGHYAIRLTAQGAAEVEVSIDGKDWQPCREAVGHHWYDWSPEPAGRRVLEARARRGPKGRWVKSEPRSFEVLPAFV